MYRDESNQEISISPSLKDVGDVIRYIGAKVGFDFIDPKSGELKADIEVTINGKPLVFYQNYLEVPLNNGDVIDIHMLCLGGG